MRVPVLIRVRIEGAGVHFWAVWGLPSKWAWWGCWRLYESLTKVLAFIWVFYEAGINKRANWECLCSFWGYWGFWHLFEGNIRALAFVWRPYEGAGIQFRAIWVYVHAFEGHIRVLAFIFGPYEGFDINLRAIIMRALALIQRPYKGAGIHLRAILCCWYSFERHVRVLAFVWGRYEYARGQY